MPDEMKHHISDTVEATGATTFFIGTRQGDPGAKFMNGHFSPSTPGWPPIMRVCPILNWEYEQVWQLLCDWPVSFQASDLIGIYALCLDLGFDPSLYTRNML